MPITRQQIDDNIDENISNVTTEDGITPDIDGTNRKYMLDYVDEQTATKEILSNKSTDVTIDAASDTKYPSVKAVKDYVDANSGSLPYKSFVSFIQFTSDGIPLNSLIYNDFEPDISFIESSTGVYQMTSFISSFTTKTVIIPFDKISGNPAKVRLPIFNFSPGVIIGYYTIQRWNNNNVRIHFWDTSNNLVNPFTLLGSSNILVDIKVYN